MITRDMATELRWIFRDCDAGFSPDEIDRMADHLAVYIQQMIERERNRSGDRIQDRVE